MEEEQKHVHAFLYKMSLQKFDAVKRYPDLYLAKGFIQVSSTPYLSLVLFIKKPSRGIQFDIDYQKLNAISKKD